MDIVRRLGAFLLVALGVAPTSADPIVRSGTQLEQLPVQGITLAMTPKQAFETLLAAGFQAGSLRTFEDWDGDGVEFVRGVYGSAAGHSSVGFGRRGERIIWISETFNAPGSPIDAVSAIDAVRRQLDIPADDPQCRAVGPHAGSCQVRDAAEGSEVNVTFTLQIMTVMRLVSVSRSRELVER